MEEETMVEVAEDESEVAVEEAEGEDAGAEASVDVGETTHSKW